MRREELERRGVYISVNQADAICSMGHCFPNKTLRVLNQVINVSYLENASEQNSD